MSHAPFRFLTRWLTPFLVLAPLAGAAPAQAAGAAACGSTSVSILFWPKGHGVRPKAGFPKISYPHVEVYGGKHTTSWPDSAEDAFLDSRGNFGSSGRCSVGIGKFSSKAVKGKTRRTAANVICSFGEDVGYLMGKIKGGARLQIVLSDGSVAVDLRIKKHGSKVSYSKKCKAHAPPG